MGHYNWRSWRGAPEYRPSNLEQRQSCIGNAEEAARALSEAKRAYDRSAPGSDECHVAKLAIDRELANQRHWRSMAAWFEKRAQAEASGPLPVPAPVPAGAHASPAPREPSPPPVRPLAYRDDSFDEDEEAAARLISGPPPAPPAEDPALVRDQGADDCDEDDWRAASW